MKTKAETNFRLKTPTLRFTPTAWAKLLFLRDCGDTEVGGFGICPTTSLLVEEVRLVKQNCTYATVSFDDDAVADFFDEQVDQGLQPDQFARIWIHTHPGNCPEPSLTDEDTFSRVFGNSNWAIMFILACGGKSYTRLRFNGEPAADLLLPTEVDFSQEFAASDSDAWEQEYLDCVAQDDPFISQTPYSRIGFEDLSPGYAPYHFREAYDELFTEPEDEIHNGYY
jgi:proteasome lid subunit RPN8/RPN11